MNARVRFSTSAGDFVVELYGEQMPRSCERFQRLVQSRFYDGTLFHRVVAGALVMGGDPQSREPGGSDASGGRSPLGAFADEHEVQLSNEVGTIGFATLNRRDSGDCQFYLNLAHNEHLDWWKGGGHAPFGRVVEGLPVLQAIAGAAQTGRLLGEQPLAPIRLLQAAQL